MARELHVYCYVAVFGVSFSVGYFCCWWAACSSLCVVGICGVFFGGYRVFRVLFFVVRVDVGVRGGACLGF